MKIYRSGYLVILILLGAGSWACSMEGGGAPSQEVDRIQVAVSEEMAYDYEEDLVYDGERAAPAGGEDRRQSSEESTQSKAQRLIYTGRIILAIYDVDSTQIKAIELIDELEGYVSKRSSERLTVRVPAANFRPALDGLAALGDALDVTWEAQDVSEQMRDLEIRLRNSLELRDRLEVLLERADTVEDALRIEKELERVTLEVERIRGQLESFEDRVAYSTIVVEFRTIRDEDLPDDEFLLPVAWVNDLGLSSVMRSAGVR